MDCLVHFEQTYRSILPIARAYQQIAQAIQYFTPNISTKKANREPISKNEQQAVVSAPNQGSNSTVVIIDDDMNYVPSDDVLWVKVEIVSV